MSSTTRRPVGGGMERGGPDQLSVASGGRGWRLCRIREVPERPHSGALISVTLSRRQFLETSGGVSAIASAGVSGTAPPIQEAAIPHGTDHWFAGLPAGRSVVRASQAMV